MNQFYKTMSSIVILLPLSAASIAETTEKPMGQMKMNQGMGMGMHKGMGDMGMGMTEEQMEQHLRSNQEYLLKMHDLSDRILAEKDSVKKEQLKNEQLELMKSHHAQMKEHRMQKMMQHQKMMPSQDTKKTN